MKVKKLILTCLLAGISVTGFAQNKLPQGKWEVKQVTVEKNTDGKIDTAVYNAANEVKSYISCPQEWEIKGENIVLRYPNGVEETANYTLEGNTLKINAPAAVLQYRYNLSSNVLTMNAVYNYVNNQPTGQVERIEEKWIIVLKK